MRTFHFHDAQKGAAITVKVTPHAKKNEVTGLLEDGTVKIKVTAPAVEGAANQALIEFLAELFKIKENQIEIVVGQTSERKLVSLVGVSPADVEATIHALVPEAEHAEDNGAATKPEAVAKPEKVKKPRASRSKKKK